MLQPQKGFPPAYKHTQIICKERRKKEKLFFINPFPKRTSGIMKDFYVYAIIDDLGSLKI